MTIDLRPQAYVGTTYKRALTKKIPVRDRCVSFRLTLPRAIGQRPPYDRITKNKETLMRKPRDFDSALRTLTDKTKALKENKRHQLGELIVATGADALDMEMLAGGLLAMVETKDAAQKESWRKHGVAFFRGKARQSADRTRVDSDRAPAGDGGRTSA
jgi:hypothetical protein